MIKISTSLVMLAAAAAVAISTPALAGPGCDPDGVRVNFGGPLGSFVARRSGPSSPYASSSKSYAQKSHRAEQKAAALAARKRIAEQKRQAAIAAAKSEAAAERKAAALAAKRKHELALAEARQERTVETRAEKTKVKAASIAAAATEAAAETSTFSEPSTGSKSLAAGQLPASETVEVAAVSPEETIVATETAPIETVATTETVAEPTTATAAPEATKAEVVASAGPQECKKFIPAVGVTITVGCEK